MLEEKLFIYVLQIHIWQRNKAATCIGAYYNGPKFKCQPASGTGNFPIKYGPKTLFKNLRLFQNYNFKIQLEVHLLFFYH